MHPDLDPRPITRLLRELPAAAARPYGFAEFERRCREHLPRPHRVPPAWMLAAVVIGAAALALVLRFGGSAYVARSRPPAIESQTPIIQPPGEPGAAPAVSAEIKEEVMKQWLASLPDEPAVARVGTRAAVTGLEDRIAEVDDLLSVARVEQAKPARLLALQRERTRLVGALLQVRYAETLVDASR